MTLHLKDLNIPENCGLVIRTNGLEELITRTKEPKLAEIIGAELTDTVILSWKNTVPDLVMVIDDNGYDYKIIDKATGKEVDRETEISTLSGGRVAHYEHVVTNARKPVNQKATELYHAVCKPGTTHQIVGDVIIIHDR
jgi:hypothetical protein